MKMTTWRMSLSFPAAGAAASARSITFAGESASSPNIAVAAAAVPNSSRRVSE